jgi:hypothetical protein
LQEIADMEPQEQRATNDALVVAAGSTYFINALCDRLAERSW